ncbi:hypothetical protein D9611_002388 [Ephemerocybe angulata]|uniref:Uncharacterized protein n=1 Tax=Ephemerocybe angulata TaxID=980116 RepID=A0A8H5C2S4_9AGAR|nr:hypothetical protein D9611_002388 [Tulosesus angulatus]
MSGVWYRLSGASPNSRWTKRKRGFKLRLDGLQAGKQRRVIAPHLDGTSADLQPMPVPSRDDILSMYEKMMESRMESCQRINKLIHDANRAHLHDR